MTFKVYTTSEMMSFKLDYGESVEINTLEDLEELQKEYENPNEEIRACDYYRNQLIVDFKEKTIEVYDTYRE